MSQDLKAAKLEKTLEIGHLPAKTLLNYLSYQVKDKEIKTKLYWCVVQCKKNNS